MTKMIKLMDEDSGKQHLRTMENEIEQRDTSSKERQQIIDEYVDESERGLSQDWVTWNENDNADALIALWAILNRHHELPLERIALCREIIYDLMKKAADGHTHQCVSNRSRRL